VLVWQLSQIAPAGIVKCDDEALVAAGGVPAPWQVVQLPATETLAWYFPGQLG
jgi:hypothetical protein